MASYDSEIIVGITAYGDRAAFGPWNIDTVLLPRAYTESVLAADGVPVLLPPHEGAAAAVDRIDALVLAGGPDIAPDRYGAPPDPRSVIHRPERDAAELAMLRRALDRGIPVLGVCRGLQLLAIAFGGSLVQHLPDVVGHTGHNPTLGVFADSTITLEPGSRVAAALGGSLVGQCHHHQAVDRVGDGLVVTGRAADGTVEAVEQPGGAFVVGVQWHPEQDDPRLFAALVAAARQDRLAA